MRKYKDSILHTLRQACFLYHHITKAKWVCKYKTVWKGNTCRVTGLNKVSPKWRLMDLISEARQPLENCAEWDLEHDVQGRQFASSSAGSWTRSLHRLRGVWGKSPGGGQEGSSQEIILPLLYVTLLQVTMKYITFKIMLFDHPQSSQFIYSISATTYSYGCVRVKYHMKYHKFHL